MTQHLTTAQIRAANLAAIEAGTLAAIAHPGREGCSYLRGCAIGCALNDQTRSLVYRRLLDQTRLVILLDDPDLLTIEDAVLGAQLQHIHDALARRDTIDRSHTEPFPVLTPHLGQPLTVELYRAVIESLPA